ncbi:unnamed protein product [Calypogeia fissa]
MRVPEKKRLSISRVLEFVQILRLQETLSKFDRSRDGNPNTPQRDQLLADIRLSRRVIGERNADIKQVQAINHQVVRVGLVLSVQMRGSFSRNANTEFGRNLGS